VIRLRGVVKSFGRQRVLDGLSLDIAASDRIALIGSNGAGKTTLIRCLLGEYTYQGEIAVQERSPRNDRREVLGAIGFAPQLPPPLKMPVAELLRFAAAVSNAEVAAIEAMTARLGLDVAGVRQRPFVKLSGGQKQKILLGIALGRQTGLLILDEPTANLDPPARRALFQVLAERASQPMIISSHRLEEVAGLVNRVIELDQGRVVLDDRVEQAGRIGGVQACRIVIGRPQAAFAKAMAEWRFTSSASGLEWTGEVADPDRLRFLGMLSRYAGLIVSLNLGEDARSQGARQLRRAAE
jgi:ABC-2 type transport system ATP-binding protein